MDRPVPLPEVYTIREIYKSENFRDRFAAELEQALDAKYRYIIIEPKKLADETARWIQAGRIIHQTAVLTGIGSICCSVIVPTRQYISFPLCAFSIIFTGIYTISWHYDHCCRYQVEEDMSILSEDSKKTATKVLVYSDNTKSSYLHRTVTVMAVLFCGFQLFRNLK